MSNQSEFYFSVEPLTGELEEQKQKQTLNLVVFSVVSFFVFCAYILVSIAYSGWISAGSETGSMMATLAIYLIAGTSFVLSCLKVFSLKQTARWIIK